MSNVVTRRITRDKLALFLRGPDGKPLHELIKAFENLFHDVAVTIPDETGGNAGEIEAAALDSSAARSDAGTALALVSALQAFVDLQSLAPTATEHPAEPHVCDGCAQLAALREEVAELRSQIRAIQITPA